MIKVKIEVNEDNSIGVREREIVTLPDGREIDAGFHRCVCAPGDDISTKPFKDKDTAAEVQAIADVVWK
jgi:hypothetical protein